MLLFKLFGGLLLLYVAYAIVQGEVMVKSGVWAKRITREDAPTGFWGAIALYIALALALILVF